ncbi:hypothetical protein RP75_23550 (plasmid) [Agrobacterium arsenijevicii]|uniref:Uncharacterized protein n=1 Tax=Agrobacterium arsenijevicii TaxID=1585697 RepID=A0ABR5D1K2_9HYPH|nr:hypothetical protein RP75_23550 [Agrobacterium arsenijevicii]
MILGGIPGIDRRTFMPQSFDRTVIYVRIFKFQFLISKPLPPFFNYLLLRNTWLRRCFARCGDSRGLVEPCRAVDRFSFVYERRIFSFIWLDCPVRETCSAYPEKSSFSHETVQLS